MLASRGFDAAGAARCGAPDLRWQRVDMRRICLCIALAACAWSWQPAASRAEFTLAGDLDVQAPISIDSLGTGGGFGIRLGSQLATPMLVINPEIGFTYATFSKSEPPQVYRGIAGLRLGFGQLVRFGVVGHFGFARVSWDRRHSRELADSGWGYDFSHTGFTYDAGVFLEFTALPMLDLGLHAIYNGVADDVRHQPDPLRWLQIGFHLALLL
jgi:hypothetical protein